LAGDHGVVWTVSLEWYPRSRSDFTS